MTTERAIEMLAKIRADVRRELNACRVNGTPELVEAIKTIGLAMVDAVERLSKQEAPK